MVNYLYDCYSVLNKVYSEKTYLKQAFLTVPIEEKNRSLTVKTCYGVLDKDILLSYYISVLAPKSPKLVVRTILKISMYLIKFLGKHDYAVIKNAVELAKKLGKSGVSGFINAFLRKFVNYEFELPKEELKYLSVKYSYPEFLVKELLKDYGREQTEKIISSENGKTAVCFYGINGEEYLNGLGVKYQKTQVNNLYLCDNFVRNADYDKGLYTFQALGSAIICDLIEPCDNLLDVCAAPGGKSVRLSYKCKNVTSFDIHPHRVELIKDYAKRMKRDNITAEVKDGKVLDESLIEKFDTVLCDVPCSGSGVINDNPDIKLNREEKDLKELNSEQIFILKTSSKYVKKGGYLYYSTCSILYRENIAIIKSFMSDVKGFSLCNLSVETENKNIDGTITLLPSKNNGLGFFVAKLKREN